MEFDDVLPPGNPPLAAEEIPSGNRVLRNQTESVTPVSARFHVEAIDFCKTGIGVTLSPELVLGTGHSQIAADGSFIRRILLKFVHRARGGFQMR
jgi:hypothetical protein